MSPHFLSVTVVPKLSQDPDGGFDVHWTVTTKGFTPTFQVQSAPTESGPWVDQLVSRTSNLFALSLGRQLQNAQPLAWFRVKMFNGSTEVASSPAMDHRNGMERRSYLRYREILRRKRIQLEKTPTLPGWLLRRRITGATCATCCDPILETPVSSECSECFGTGISGGYYSKLSMRADWAAGTNPRTSTTVDKDQVGPITVQRSVAVIFAIPDAKSHDVWIDQGTRYAFLIEKSTPELWNGSCIGQTLELSRLPAQHPIYNFDLDE